MAFGGYSYRTFDPKSIKDFYGYRDGGQDRTTGKRVKSVFNTSQVFHVWAQRTQTFGKNGKGNVFFEGDRLFDYGHHFCLGQFVTNASDELACLLNSGSYGPTTSEHQGHTARAVPEGIPTFTIPDAGYNNRASASVLDLDAILQSYAERAAKYAATAKRARKEWSKDWNTARAGELVKEAKAFAEFFGIPAPEMNLESLVAAAEESRKRVLAEEKRREEERREKTKGNFDRWLAGESDWCPTEWYKDAKGGVRMRVKGDLLQTAMGAEVPLSHAVKAFKFLKLIREKNYNAAKPSDAQNQRFVWERNGRSLNVGHFKIDAIQADGGFRAGCHYITWDQVVAVAAMAGVTDTAPADTSTATH